MKKSSYQKQKELIAQLRADIETLVLNPNSMKAIRIASEVMFKKQCDNILMFGNKCNNTGIIEQLI